MDSHSARRILEPLLTIVCPTAVCILIGLAAFGARVFDLKKPPFIFVAVGLIVGVFVLAAQKLSLRQFVGITILVIIAMIAASGSWPPRLMPRAAVVVLALAGAALLNVKVLAKSSLADLIGRFVAWSIVFMLAYMLAGVVLLRLFYPTEITPYLLLYGQYAVLIGVGLGAGFKANQWLMKKLHIDKP